MPVLDGIAEMEPRNGGDVLVAKKKGHRGRHPNSRSDEEFMGAVKAAQERFLKDCPVVDGSRKVLVVEKNESSAKMILFGKVVLEVDSEGLIRTMVGDNPRRLFAAPEAIRGSHYETYVALKSVTGNLKGFALAVAANAWKMLDKTAARYATEADAGKAMGQFYHWYNDAIKFMAANDIRNLPRVVVSVCIASKRSPSALRDELGPRRWRWLLKQRGAHKWVAGILNRDGGRDPLEVVKACADFGVSRPQSVKAIEEAGERIPHAEGAAGFPNYYKMMETVIRDLEQHRDLSVKIVDKGMDTRHLIDIARRHVREDGDIPLQRQALESMGSITRWIDQEEARQHALDAQRAEAFRARIAQERLERGQMAPMWADEENAASEWGNYFEPVEGVDGYTMKEITTQLELLEEGVEMKHCVAGYHNRVAQGISQIFSVRGPTPKDRATMEVRRQNGGVEMVQLYSHCNQKPSIALEMAATKMFNKLKLRAFALALAS